MQNPRSAWAFYKYDCINITYLNHRVMKFRHQVVRRIDCSLIVVREVGYSVIKYLFDRRDFQELRKGGF